MLETLISSKTRIKLLLKFFLNSNTTSYLRGLESEFGESSNAIRVELNRLEKAGMLSSSLEGNKKYFRANIKHPLFDEVHKIIIKYVGIDHIIENVINNLGEVTFVYVAGEFAKGLDSEVIDLILVGKINKEYLIQLIDKVEPLVKRKIRYLVYESMENFDHDWLHRKPSPFLIWSRDEQVNKIKNELK